MRLWSKAPRRWVLGFFENFCVKSNLTVCKATFNCELEKNGGGQDLLLVIAIKRRKFYTKLFCSGW